MIFFEIEEKAKELFELSSEELHKRGVEALLAEELKHAENQLYGFMKISNMHTAFEKNTIRTEELSKMVGRQSRITHLKTRITSIKKLLDILRKSNNNPDWLILTR